MESVDGGLSRIEWNILNTSLSFDSKYYDCCPEPYMSASVWIELERNAPAYCWTIKVPAIGMVNWLMINSSINQTTKQGNSSYCRAFGGQMITKNILLYTQIDKYRDLFYFAIFAK